MVVPNERGGGQPSGTTGYIMHLHNASDGQEIGVGTIDVQ